MDLSSVKALMCTNTFTDLFILSASVLVFWYVYKRFGRRSLPPGPWGLPIVGYLPFLAAETHKHFLDLSKKYGQIFGLTIGSRYVVVLNDIESLTETFKKDGVNSRPEKSFQMCSEFDSIADMNDAPWKEHRKFFSFFQHRLLKTEGGVPNLQNILNEETDILLEKLSNLKDKNRVNLHDIFAECINNTPMKYIMSRSVPDDHPFVQSLSVQIPLLLNQGSIQDLTFGFPEWRWLLRPIMQTQRDLKKVTKYIEAFISEEIVKHKQSLDPENPRDYMDFYLLRQKQEGNDVMYSDGTLNSNVQIMLAAGSDTTIISSSWIFLMLAQFPEAQEKVYREIMEVCGPDQKPRWAERARLPYTSAFINEGQRFKTIVPVSSIRKATKDIEVNGFLIPKETTLVGNLWAIHNDEKYWGDPSNFRPERFLGADGAVNADKCLVGFSLGKRDCPGKPQALMELFFILTTVVQKYKVLPSTGGINLEQNNNLVGGPLHPFVKIEARIL